jgi:hypothetical protein
MPQVIPQHCVGLAQAGAVDGVQARAERKERR